MLTYADVCCRMQARYANDPQKMNEMIAQLYQEENVNPLAGIH